MKKDYKEPISKVHQLSPKCGLLQSLSGGGKGTSGDKGEARDMIVSDDENNTESGHSTGNIWSDKW